MMSKYHDINGNDISLYKLVRNEPEWAQSRIENSVPITALQKLINNSEIMVDDSDGCIYCVKSTDLQKLIDEQRGR